MKLEQAQKIAQSLMEDLKGSCHRIEIGGSIRRKKPEVEDIELICIPVFENPLFERIAAKGEKYEIIKMGEKYTQIEVFDEHATGGRQYIKVDVFTATFRTWGYIFMIRTGPADFSKWVVNELKHNGFLAMNGEIFYNGTPCTIPSEDDLFFLLGIDYIEPEYRFKDVVWK